MTGRDDEIEAFLAAGPWRGASRAPLAGDASNRRYERVFLAGKGVAVLMDASPEKGEDVRPFIDVTTRLRDGAGLSAPAILQADTERGFLLLEDLGDALYARVLKAGAADETELYGAAIDLLAVLHARPDLADGLPPYDLAVYRREAGLLPDWYLPAALGGPLPPGARESFDRLIDDTCAVLAPVDTPVCVLRDYHAENLLWLPGRAGLARVGLLDYQDALAGHPAYDVVSLLEDARRDTTPALREAMLARYIARTGARDAPFRAAHAALGAQRNLKILGIFARLWLRDGKPGYLALMPRVWSHLLRDLEHPALSTLRDWVEAHVPAPVEEVQARLREAR